MFLILIVIFSSLRIGNLLINHLVFSLCICLHSAHLAIEMTNSVLSTLSNLNNFFSINVQYTEYFSLDEMPYLLLFSSMITLIPQIWNIKRYQNYSVKYTTHKLAYNFFFFFPTNFYNRLRKCTCTFSKERITDMYVY